MNIGKIIRDIRKERNLTLEQLAVKCGDITGAAISYYENGRSLPRKEILCVMCMILGVSVGEVYLKALESHDFKDDQQELFSEIKKLITNTYA